jgi:regulator of sirC expression with transglutaminase-like and TPR domain
MEALRRAIQDQPEGRLDVAALEIASIETPDLDPEPFLGVLDRIASGIAARLPASTDGREFIRVANDYLFGDLGFHGNEIDYNDPRNSCLNYVLDRRTGIPIALSVVYIEVARRLGQPVSGIGLPGHFIVEYNDGEFATYIDPFHSGKLLTLEDCRQLARDRTGAEADATALAPVGTRYILVRMLNNLRSAYFRSKQFGKMVAVTDLLIEAFPRNPEYYKARGVARLRMRQFRGAQKDLELYLKYSPNAEDREQIKQQLGSIHRWLGRLN